MVVESRLHRELQLRSLMCNLTMIPTDGTCEAIDTWKIREGTFDSTRLDGLCIALILRWPNPIHRGNGRCVVFIATAQTTHSGKACLKLALERQVQVVHSRFSRQLTPSLLLCVSDVFATSVKADEGW
jgi:hypothetical protein